MGRAGRRPWKASPGRGGIGRTAAVARHRRAPRATEPRRGRHLGARHHLHRLPRRPRHRSGLADGHRAESDRRVGMGDDRARLEAATLGAEPLHRRRLPRAPGRRRRRLSRRVVGRFGQPAHGVRGHVAEVRGVGTHLRQRSRARRRMVSSMCSRTICECRRASVTCCRTGRSPSVPSPISSSGNRSCPSTTIPIGFAGCSSRWPPTISMACAIRRSSC